MGDIAEMMLDGTLDEMTGEYLGPGPGYPRSLDPDHWSNQRGSTGKRMGGPLNPQSGVFNWLSNRNCKAPVQVVQKYQDEVLHVEGTPKIKTICKHIQKDFKGFTTWYMSIKNTLR